MSDSVRTLIERWREKAEYWDGRARGISFKECADELSAALAAVPPQEKLLNALRGLVGLVQLVSHRDDMPIDLNLCGSYRYRDAVIAIAEAEGAALAAVPPQVIPDISPAYIDGLLDRLTNDATYECNDSPDPDDDSRDWCARQREFDDFCTGCRTNALLADAVRTIRQLAALAAVETPQAQDDVAERWRRAMYPHVEAATFHEYLADLSLGGWDDVRKEVATVRAILVAPATPLSQEREQ